MEQGVVLLDYSIQGNKYTFMKRSLKRSTLMLFFSMNGIYHHLRGRQKMVFVTGNILADGNRVEEVEKNHLAKDKIKNA